ncbi:MAG: MFS transporter [Acidobacteria bacterium]|nr:MFS transporter [Acidobacteriota bacterium]
MPSAHQKRLFAAACAGIFGFGLVIGFLGPLFPFPRFQEILAGDSSRQGSLSGILYAGVLAATPFVGPVIDRFGNKLVLVASSIVVAASLAGFAVLATYPQALAAAAALGLGGGGLNIAANALTADVFGDRRGPFLNYLGIFFGIGGLFVPTLVLAARHVSLAVVIVAAMALPVAFALAFALMEFPAAHHARGFELAEVLRVARYPGVLMFAALLFFESGAEATLGMWNPTFAHYLGAGSVNSSAAAEAYLAFVMLGRIAAGYLLRRISKTQLVVASAAAGTLACLFLAVAPSFPVLVLASALVGLATAAIYPTALAVAGDRYQRFAATVFSLIFTVALVGGWVFPKSAGILAGRYGVRSPMFLPAAGLALVLMVALRLRASEAPL